MKGTLNKSVGESRTLSEFSLFSGLFLARFNLSGGMR
jgi:hypothetical protein